MNQNKKPQYQEVDKATISAPSSPKKARYRKRPAKKSEAPDQKFGTPSSAAPSHGEKKEQPPRSALSGRYRDVSSGSLQPKPVPAGNNMPDTTSASAHAQARTRRAYTAYKEEARTRLGATRARAFREGVVIGGGIGLAAGMVLGRVWLWLW